MPRRDQIDQPGPTSGDCLTLPQELGLLPRRQGHHPTIGVTGEQHTGLFERFADSRDVERQGGTAGDIGHGICRESDPIHDREPPSIPIRSLDAASWKDVRSAHEGNRIVASNEEDLHPMIFVTQQHDS
jgi:hypothetical protein